MGKATIVYVIGLTLIIGLALSNINRSSLDSMDTYATYFGRTMAHNIALAAANVGASRVLFDPTFGSNFSGTFSGGTYDVIWADTGMGQTFTKFMTATSSYNAGGETIRDTIRGVFNRRILSRYSWFTESETNGYKRPNGANGPYFGHSDWKITGDSVFGYAHTNSKFNLAGQPYFGKKVTATNAPSLMTLFGKKDPIYNEGYEWGVTVTRPYDNLTTLQTLANGGSPIASRVNGQDVGLEFQTDQVHVRVPYNTGATLDTTMKIADLGASKVFGVTGGDIHVKGTYQGQLTVVAMQGANPLKGNVWIDGDVVASDNPRYNPSSTDMLGLVAERMGYITKDPARTTSSVLYVQAAIYCHNGEFTAEEFWNIPKSGSVNLYGSLCQKTAGSLGVFTGAGLQNGMFYHITHDPRMVTGGPPQFPYSGNLRLVAWWEN